MIPLLASLVAPALVLAVYGLGPGLLLARWLHADRVSRLAVATGLGLIVLYLQGLALFAVDAPAALRWLLGAACVLAAVLQRGQVLRLLRLHRATLGAVACLVTWSMLWLLQVHQFSGGGWAGDWLEHYQRTQVFLGERAVDAVFLTVYTLPARPPLMNLVAAELARFGPGGYPLVSSIYLLLNVLPALVLVPLARAAAGGGHRQAAAALVVLLLMANPLWIQNTTYLWTKLFAAFWVLVAVWLFARWLRWPRRGRLLQVALLLAAGALAHYSAGVYLVIVAGYAVVVIARHPALRAASLVATTAAAALLASWFTWSLARFGLAATALSNSSVTDNPARGLIAGGRKILGNLVDTLVPHVVRGVGVEQFGQEHPLGELRDHVFLLTQTNLLPSVGLLSGMVLCVTVAHEGLLTTTARARHRFWLVLTCAGVVAGVAVHGARDTYGLAHICLQPLVLLALCLLAARAHALSQAWRAVLVLGLCLDTALGIGVHFWLQARTSTVVTFHRGLRAVIMDDWLVSTTAAANAKLKAVAAVHYWNDELRELAAWTLWPTVSLSLVIVIGAAGLLWSPPARRSHAARRRVSHRSTCGPPAPPLDRTSLNH